jgi:hypothetical protein
LVEATKLGADPFVWISPLQKHLTHPVPDKSNPLTVCSRFYYLDKMYPEKQHGQLTFLSDLNNISTEMERELGCVSSALSKNERSRRVWRKLPTNWNGMSECQRMKYASIKRQVLNSHNFESYFQRYQSTRTAGVEFDNNDFLSKVEEKRRLPSYQCLKFLKKRGYTQVILLVGSDRLEAFKKYNQKSGKNLFDKFDIDVAGAPRGMIGQGEQGLISPPKMVRANSNDINSDTLDMMEGLLSNESNESNESDESKEPNESKTVLTHDEQKRRSEKYSGTITRNTALKGEVVKFVDAVKIGTMTNFDCLCMMNEIRTVGDNTDTVYPKISEDDFMKIVYPQEVVPQEVVPQEVVPDEYMNTFAITGPDKRRELRKQRGYGRKTRKKKRKKNRKKTRKKRGGGKKTRRKRRIHRKRKTKKRRGKHNKKHKTRKKRKN